MLEQRVYHKNYKPPAEQVIFDIEQRCVGTLENIVCFTGLPKAGKSTFIHSCIASAFVSDAIFGMRIKLPKKNNVITYIDTESSQFDFYRGIDRIKNFLPIKKLPDNFHAYNFRDLSPKEIKDVLSYYLTSVPQCSVLIIDGLLDTLTNYNDETESRLCIDWLKKITKQHNILVIGVVHVGKTNLQTLGTFGSMIDRYCQSVMLVEKMKDSGYFELKPKFMRSDADFSPILIGRENDGFVLK